MTDILDSELLEYITAIRIAKHDIEFEKRGYFHALNDLTDLFSDSPNDDWSGKSIVNIIRKIKEEVAQAIAER